MSGAKIERFLGRACLHSPIVAMGRSQQTRARESFRPHFHAVFEICLITRGAVDWWIAERKFHLAANSIFITQPGERHGTLRGVLEPCVLNWIQIDHRKLKKIPLRRQLSSLPIQVKGRASKLLPYLNQMLDECRHPRRDSSEVIEANLLMFLSLLVRYAHSGPFSAKLDAKFRLIREFLASSTDPELTVGDICNHFDLSRSYVHQLFVRHLGIGPQAYLMGRKLNLAATLLASGQKSVTEIAHLLNFSSSQHFATAFKNHYGITPRQWDK